VQCRAMLPNLSCMGVATGVGEKRSRPVSYVEHEECGDSPLVSTIVLAQLPGPLKISNACFVEEARRVREAKVGLLVVVTNNPVHDKDTWGDARVVHVPFEDTLGEKDAVVVAAIRGAVECVQAYWSEHPDTSVLVHCNEGQNRSAAVVLALLLAYGVPRESALESVYATSTADNAGPGVAWERAGWEKLVGENGKRLRALVLATPWPCVSGFYPHYRPRGFP